MSEHSSDQLHPHDDDQRTYILVTGANRQETPVSICSSVKLTQSTAASDLQYAGVSLTISSIQGQHINL